MTTPGIRIQPHISTLPRYKPGQSAPGARKISSNEMPQAPQEQIINVAIAALREVNRYPDLLSTQLREELASLHGVGADQIVVGTGSSAVLLAALTIVGGQGGNVIFPWRSFESYPIAVPATHSIPVPIPLTDRWEHDIPAMLDAVTDETVAFILCSPNNPTGNALTIEQIRDVARALPPHVMLIVDEAYIEFATSPGVETAIAMLDEFPNMVILRTFSKAYSLAGLRVGYGIAHPDITAAMTAVSVPFGVSGVAQAAALAALQNPQEGQVRVSEIVTERERILSELSALGVTTTQAQGNFYWLPDFGEDLVTTAAQAGLIVRPFPEGIRVTVGSREENDAFLQVLAELTSRA